MTFRNTFDADGIASSAGCRWDRDGIGSADREQRRDYAYRVTLSLTGGEYGDRFIRCPITGLVFDARECDVDKIDPSKGYRAGNVALISTLGNKERSVLQGVHDDVAKADLYAAQVRRASVGVVIRPKTVVHADPVTATIKGIDGGAMRGVKVGCADHIERGPYGIGGQGWPA